MATKKERQLKNDFTEITYEFRGKPEPQKWHKFLYDGEKGTIFNRTAKNWAQLGLFYLIFYIVLASMFAICMQGLLSTLTHEYPKWQLDESRIGTNPGLGFRPISNNTEQGSLIWFDTKSQSSIKTWTNLIDDFLLPYNNRSLLAGAGVNQVNCNAGENPAPGKVCLFDTKSFGKCSQENAYGYNNSSPCVFLKLNRIYNWVPEFYNDPTDLPVDMPESLKTYIGKQKNKNQVWVSCNAEHPADREILPNEVQYFPTQGFSGEYYPYTNAPGYLSPLVAVQFPHPIANRIANIECRAWAKNIQYRPGRERTGSVHFELMLD